MAERLTETQAEREAARKEATKMAQEAARLAGQLTAHKEQIATLLVRLDRSEPGARKERLT